MVQEMCEGVYVEFCWCGGSVVHGSRKCMKVFMLNFGGVGVLCRGQDMYEGVLLCCICWCGCFVKVVHGSRNV